MTLLAGFLSLATALDITTLNDRNCGLNQGQNLGVFASATSCAQAADRNGCTTFMWNSGDTDAGCHCCANGLANNPDSNWNSYMLDAVKNPSDGGCFDECVKDKASGSCPEHCGNNGMCCRQVWGYWTPCQAVNGHNDWHTCVQKDPPPIVSLRAPCTSYDSPCNENTASLPDGVVLADFDACAGELDFETLNVPASSDGEEIVQGTYYMALCQFKGTDDVKQNFQYGFDSGDGGRIVVSRLDGASWSEPVSMCCAIQRPLRAFPQTVISDRGYANEKDGDIDFQALEDSAICGLYSEYVTGAQDRLFKFKTCKYLNNMAPKTSVSTTGNCNTFHGAFDCDCPPDKGVVGFESEHDDGWEDRKWRLKCAEFTGMTVDTQNPRWTKMAGFRAEDTAHEFPVQDIRCNDDEVACGLGGVHNQFSMRSRDRGYRLKCCKVHIDTLPCQRASIAITEIPILLYNSPPTTITLDELTTRACGYTSPVTHTLTEDRTVTVEETNSFSTSKSMSETFSHSVSTSVTMSFSFEAFLLPYEISASIGYDFDTSMETSSSTKNFEQTKTTEKSSFSNGFTFAAAANSISHAVQAATQQKKDMSWVGEATCYDARGNVLEVKPISGTYTGVETFESNVDIVTEHCPVDGYEVQRQKYCHKDHLLKNTDGTYMHGTSKFQAVIACNLNESCECIYDRDCMNLDLSSSFGRMPAEWWNTVVTGNFMFCGAGCSEDLYTSSHSCVFTKTGAPDVQVA